METMHSVAFGEVPGTRPTQAPEAVTVMLRFNTLGWSAKRIARELGCSRGTARRYLH